MSNDRVYYSHDAEMHAMRDRAVLMLVSLTFGLGVGAALALLFAPTTGKTVRDNLSKTVGQSWNDGRDAVEPLMKQVEEEFSELKKNVEAHLK